MSAAAMGVSTDRLQQLRTIEPVSSALSSVGAAIRDALRGAPRQTLIDQPIDRALLLLAAPMVLEMLMESLFAVCDIFFIGHLGAAAVATVGITESVIGLIYVAGSGLATGATAVVARRVGEQDADGAARAAVQSMLLGVMIAVLIGAAGVWLGPNLIRLMGASDDVVRTGAMFARVTIGGSGIVLLLFLANGVFRGAGDAARAMHVLWFANAVNLVLSPCFIFGVGPFPALGVTGAAVGTLIGRGCGVLLQLFLLTRGAGRLSISRPHLAIDIGLMKTIVDVSGTAMLQNFIATVQWAGIVKILSGFGSAVVAGNTIAIRLIVFALLPSIGLGNAAATLVGQNLGAGRADRAEATARRAAACNAWYLGAICVLFVLCAPSLLGLFTSDPEAARPGVEALRIVAIGFMCFGYGMVLAAAFNGAGDTRTPMLINLWCLWGCNLPLAWLLAYPAGLGATGVFVSVSATFVVLALVTASLFNQGRWKTRRV